jgi:putative nucleotidyltransferase with HDIG domain
MAKRILFVDDEPNVLSGLQRTLRPMQYQWEMEFVPSGEEALQALGLRPFDAVVTDMRMPGMTGAQLLDVVRDRFPQTIRIVLSGQSERESLVRSISSAHQFLSKPCEPEKLKSVIEGTIALANLLEDEALKKFISRLKCVPSIPTVYQEFTKEMRSADPSAQRLGKIISQDMGMTSKVLQTVNSAGYGIRVEISDPARAVMMLGIDTIQAMLLSLGVFSSFDPRVLSAQEASRLWDHSVLVSRFTRLIAKAEGVAPADLGSYESAGLLHDIGKLVMASADPKEYRLIENVAFSTETDQCVVEKEVFGCSHPEVGAYLLGLWGLPSHIIEAVAWHHEPSKSPSVKFSSLAAVHVASALDGHMDASFGQAPVFDEAFLARLGLTGRREVWVQLCHEQFEREQLAVAQS